MEGHVMDVQNFCDGRFDHADTFLKYHAPSTGKLWARVQDSGKSEVDEAVDRAKTAFIKWSKTPVEKRCKYLYQLADVMEKSKMIFVDFQAVEQGVPEGSGKADVQQAIDNFRHFASVMPQHLGISQVFGNNKYLCYTTNKPIGVCGLITSCELPLQAVTMKIAAAIACGNTCVLKPSVHGSTTVHIFCKMLLEAGLHPGVINIVFGSGHTAGEELVNHPDVHLISFSGSNVVGKHILAVAGKTKKKISLQMRGNNPSIIFADCKFDEAMESTLKSSFMNSGQLSYSSKRIFVQREIYEKFLTKFILKTNQLKLCGYLGPMKSKGYMEKVEYFIKEAIKDGGEVQSRVTLEKNELYELYQNGYHHLPTIITGLENDSNILKEDACGPLVIVMSFETEEEAIKKANDSKYGLSATVWTTDSAKAQRVANELQVGVVWVNNWFNRDLDFPFGGMKCSGIGRESTKHSIEFYTMKKNIYTSMTV